MNRELIYSIYLFITSAIGSIVCFSFIIKKNSYDNTLIKEIKPGQHEYILLNNDDCIGNFSYNLNLENNIAVLTSEGALNVSYLNKNIPVKYKLESNFNSIGQMGGTILRFEVENSFIQIGAKNIDPILIKIKTNFIQNDREFTWNTAGPVLLKKQLNGSYSLSGLSLDKFKKDNLKLLPDSQKIKIPSELRVLNQPLSACKNQANFDISSALEEIRKLYSGYLPL